MSLTIRQSKNTYNNSSTLISSDLLSEFDTTGKIISQIAPGTTSGDIAFLKSPNMSNTLANIESSFDTALKEYQKYYTEQYTDAQRMSDIMYQENLRRSAEISQNLSTGQSAISKQMADISKQETDEAIKQSVQQSYTETEAKLQTAFSEQLTSLFGKIDDSGRFSKLVEYSEYADLATNAMLNVVTQMLLDEATETEINLAKQKGYIDEFGIVNATGYLRDKGILEEDIVAGGYYLSDIGYSYMDAVLNSISANEPGGVYDKIIDEMIDATYDFETQDNWSDIKRSQIEQEYSDFLSDYAQEWRYTHVGLWSQSKNGVEVDMYYSNSTDTEVDNTDVDNTEVDNTDVDNTEVDNTDVDNTEVDNTQGNNSSIGGTIENPGTVTQKSWLAGALQSSLGTASQGSDKVGNSWQLANSATVTYGSIYSGHNIDISVNGVAYRVEVEGAISDEATEQINSTYFKQTGQNMPANTVIKIGNDIYVRSEDRRIYRINRREVFNTFDYQNLLEALK